MQTTTFTSLKAVPKSWETPQVPQAITNNVLYTSIADQAVKNITIQDSMEEMVDLQIISNPRIKQLAAFHPRYINTYKAFSKVRHGLYQKLLTMLETLPENIGIAYFEGFRPLAKQKEYFGNKLKETLITIQDKELAYQETAKLVSPFIDNIPVHCTGAAIDMTLFRMINNAYELIDMGQFDVIFGVNAQQETFSVNTNEEQRTNRLLLLQAATNAGLVNYGYEWWHYSFGDKAWAYVKGQKYAIYGLVVDKNDPILSINKDAYLKQF